jgi:dethiobiotin synthetase
MKNVCVICGQEFEPKRKKTTCSTACLRKLKKQNSEAQIRKLIEAECNNCAIKQEYASLKREHAILSEQMKIIENRRTIIKKIIEKIKQLININ